MSIEQIKEAIRTRDLPAVGRIVEHLRVSKGLNYMAIYRVVNAVCPIELAEWDALLEEVDNAGW